MLNTASDEVSGTVAAWVTAKDVCLVTITLPDRDARFQIPKSEVLAHHLSQALGTPVDLSASKTNTLARLAVDEPITVATSEFGIERVVVKGREVYRRPAGQAL